MAGRVVPDRLPVTVLSGFLGAGKVRSDRATGGRRHRTAALSSLRSRLLTCIALRWFGLQTTLLSNILNNRSGLKVCLVVNDMSEVNIDAGLVKTGDFALSRLDEKMVEMQNGCICCTLREDLLVEVARLAGEKRFDYLVIESTGVSEPLPVAETFTFEIPGYAALSDIAMLDTMVTVVDAVRFGKDVRSGSQSLAVRFEGTVPKEDERTVIDLLVDQIEFANVVIINKVSATTAEDVGLVEAVVKKLNPDAIVYKTDYSNVPISAVLNTKLFSFEKAMNSAGWLKEIRGQHKPETLEYGISSFVYRRRRPFHPQRLWYLLVNNELKNLLRSKGWFWLASQHAVFGEWSQAGEMYDVDPGGLWFAAMPVEDWPTDGDAESIAAIRSDFDPDNAENGDRRQEIVFIGIDHDRAAIEASLDACLLTDAEMVLGVEAWKSFTDPFAEQWMQAMGEGEGEGEGEDQGEDGEAMAQD